MDRGLDGQRPIWTEAYMDRGLYGQRARWTEDSRHLAPPHVTGARFTNVFLLLIHRILSVTAICLLTSHQITKKN